MTRPPIPEPPYAGGCLCGGVRYAVTSRPLSINACHCTDCKKLTGATNLLMLTFSRGDLSWTGETHTFAKTADSGRQAIVRRCAACGTRLFHEPVSAPHYVLVAAGTLDDSSWAIPTAHIWTRRAAPHEHFQPDALIIEGQPPDRETMIAAFNRIYG